MVVQHNLTAMNSNRMLGVTTKSQAKSTEKLSSGYKINRAADDAAGLSISEKMRKQIRGLTQASSNAQDGISAVQTAEGALNEVQDMLQRMNELAVKASNGTMSENDRSYVQNEVDQLVTEIDRVSETTKFNETYLLKGEDGSNGNSIKATAATSLGALNGVGVSQDVNTTITDGDVISLGTVEMKSDNAKYTFDDEAKANDTGVATVQLKTWNTDVDGSTFTVTKKDGTTADVTGAILKSTYGIESTVVTGDAGVTTGKATISKSLDTTTGNTSGYTLTGSYTGGLDSYAPGATVKATASVNNGKAVLTLGEKKALTLSFQVGADTTKDNKIDVQIASMSAESIGVKGIKVDGATSKNADAAVDTIANAIQRVSSQRSALGAVQNRLEHTINNLDNVVENTTSAESAIRDTNMATEMVKYSNNNILSQAGQAMLAQANQSNQGVLSLLQ